MTSKADYLAAAALLTQLANAQPDDVVVPRHRRHRPLLRPLRLPTDPFANLSYYPPNAKFSIDDAEFAPGATECIVRCSIDKPTPMTLIARVVTRNGTAIQGQFGKIDTKLIWRPGDPLERTVRIPILKPIPEGGTFDLIMPDSMRGGGLLKGVGHCVCKAGAVPIAEIPWTGRAARTFAPTGTPQFDLDIPNMAWKDGGGPALWNTALPHGRTQPGNAETGLYLDDKDYLDRDDPTLVINDRPFAIEGNILRIHSQRLRGYAGYGGTYYNYGAAVLTGQRIAETQILYGQYEFDIQTCNRAGSWPALWFMSANGGWPPELDLYEGFGFGAAFNFATTTTSAIHNGSNDHQTYSRGMTNYSGDGQYAGTLDSAFHKWQADIQPDFITLFMDGVEVCQYTNPFHFHKWFPLMNVAVKTNGDYTGGSADMLVRGFKVWNSQAA
jgi:hypothetical protein